MRIKNYLSYSQYMSFKGGQYQRVYLDGKRLSSKYLTFGGDFAKALEDESKEKRFIWAIKKLPKAKEREKEYRVNLGGVPLFGKLDGLSIRKGKAIIDEYKTGKRPWTQSKADATEQLTFYSIMVHHAEKIDYKNIACRLHWLETIEDTDGSLIFTGKVKHFNTVRTLKDEIEIYPKIKKAWVGIEKLIDAYLKN